MYSRCATRETTAFCHFVIWKTKLNIVGMRSNSHTDGVCYCIIMTPLSAVFWIYGFFRRNKYKTDTWQSISMALTLDHGGLGRLTDAGWKRFVPHAPVPAQTGQCAAAVETVSRIAWVQNMGVGEMAVVLDFVAITGDARFFAADKVETWRRSSKDGDRHLNIRTFQLWLNTEKDLSLWLRTAGVASEHFSN